ncbi:MAG: NAD(P)H-hydrate dehydratase [Erysipelotrichia bacterium]|nr:NAD(P)H-hydrate dehydratase [Erysipelotrichia bacterium]NCC55495.1 NAD(P)H-hydrate dehydratase [Erysipelotrichia bacterium]
MKLVNKEQMNKIDHDASAIYKIDSLLLMEHAGYGIYTDFIKRFDHKNKVVIVCGNGNNGGDGFVLARLLHLSNYHVAISFLGEETKLSKDAASNYAIVKALSIPFDDDYETYDIIVDCLFGTGLSRTITGKYAEVITQINHLHKIVVSVDIPSGIDCENGSIHGCAIKANLTYTMQCGKTGLYLWPGREYSNEIVIVDIFIPTALIDACESQTYLIEKDEMKALLPKRSSHSNKGSYGKLLCIGGSDGMSGAICMAAKSALNAGCGLLTCAVPSNIQEVVATNLWESMSIALPATQGHISKDAWTLLQPALSRFSCVLIGCGITRANDIQVIMKGLLDSDLPLIIDADALYALKGYLAQYAHRQNIIITPHMKEFAYLIDESVENVVANSMAFVKQFTKQYPQYTLVLKSDTTIIAQGACCYLNTYGNNGLAVGGSGDVLAGLIAGLYAQNKDCFHAALLGVFLHAYSGDQILKEKSVYSLLPSDIIKVIADVMKSL